MQSNVAELLTYSVRAMDVMMRIVFTVEASVWSWEPREIAM